MLRDHFFFFLQKGICINFCSSTWQHPKITYEQKNKENKIKIWYLGKSWPKLLMYFFLLNDFLMANFTNSLITRIPCVLFFSLIPNSIKVGRRLWETFMRTHAVNIYFLPAHPGCRALFKDFMRICTFPLQPEL